MREGLKVKAMKRSMHSYVRKRGRRMSSRGILTRKENRRRKGRNNSKTKRTRSDQLI